MKLSHLTSVLSKTKPTNTGFNPKAIILSVGINDRANTPGTARINADKAIRAAQVRFPNSKIYFAQIHVSNILNKTEQNILNSLNEHLNNKYPDLVLNKLPPQSFATDRLGVHWTDDCANEIISHWISQVN